MPLAGRHGLRPAITMVVTCTPIAGLPRSRDEQHGERSGGFLDARLERSWDHVASDLIVLTETSGFS